VRRVAPDAVLKLGGSLCRHASGLKRLVAALASLSRGRTLVIVPGGGEFADAIRDADRRFALDRASSHWMAILAMDQTAYLVAGLAEGAAGIVRSAREVERGRLNVLAPSTWMLEADPLPHSWKVTSDSIAAWVAANMGARRLVLLKSLDGAFASARSRHRLPKLLPRARCGELGDLVDPYFARAWRPGTPCWIVNGKRPERLARLFSTGSTYGTEVIRSPACRRSTPRAAEGAGRRRADDSHGP